MLMSSFLYTGVTSLGRNHLVETLTLNAGSSVLNKKKNGFTVWKVSSDCTYVLSLVLETFSNYATPDKVILVENVIVNKN